MKALILAAGMGNRLEELTEEKPKALVPVLGKELLLYQLDFLRHPKISEIGIVAGFLSDRLIRFLKSHQITARTFLNPRYEEGSILTVRAATDFFNDDILLMNVDHIYPQHLLNQILEQIDGITAVCDFDRKLVADDMKIKKGKNGAISRIDKKLTDFDGGYIGMTVIPKERTKTYIASIEKTIQNRGFQVSVEVNLQELANAGEAISIADCSGIGWLEVDNQEDLARAEERLGKKEVLL